MAIWDKLKDGIDKANKVAQEAIDEGKTRMDARKARQAADSAAESLGYAVFRAWENGRELEAESLDRLARALRDHEQEAARLEQAAEESTEWRRKQDAPGDASADVTRDASADATRDASADVTGDASGDASGDTAPHAAPRAVDPDAAAAEASGAPARPAGDPPVA